MPIAMTQHLHCQKCNTDEERIIGDVIDYDAYLCKSCGNEMIKKSAGSIVKQKITATTKETINQIENHAKGLLEHPNTQEAMTVTKEAVKGAARSLLVKDALSGAIIGGLIGIPVPVIGPVGGAVIGAILGVYKNLNRKETFSAQQSSEITKDKSTQLRELYDLYKDGALTSEEYEREKRKTLDKP